MGRAWDKSGVAASVELWREAFRVLKPGAHLAAFGGTRALATAHQHISTIEDAGSFEISNSLSGYYGSGFPTPVRGSTRGEIGNYSVPSERYARSRHVRLGSQIESPQ